VPLSLKMELQIKVDSDRFVGGRLRSIGGRDPGGPASMSGEIDLIYDEQTNFPMIYCLVSNNYIL
jgi:hypothetical protein